MATKPWRMPPGRARGVRVGDLYHRDRFREHLGRVIAYTR